MNVVNQYGEKRNGFAEVVAFCHVTCKYFNRFLLQGVDRNWRQTCLFYLVPGLISEVYWQVNSRRSIFRIVDPTSDLELFWMHLFLRIIKTDQSPWNLKLLHMIIVGQMALVPLDYSTGQSYCSHHALLIIIIT